MEVAIDKATITKASEAAFDKVLWDYTAARDDIAKLEHDLRRSRRQLDAAEAFSHKARADYDALQAAAKVVKASSDELNRLVLRLQRKSGKLKTKRDCHKEFMDCPVDPRQRKIREWGGQHHWWSRGNHGRRPRTERHRDSPPARATIAVDQNIGNRELAIGE